MKNLQTVIKKQNITQTAKLLISQHKFTELDGLIAKGKATSYDYSQMLIALFDTASNIKHKLPQRQKLPLVKSAQAIFLRLAQHTEHHSKEISTTARALATSLHRLGKIMWSVRVPQQSQPKFYASNAQLLLNRLNESEYASTQHLANALYGLGKMAASRCLQGQFDARALQQGIIRLVGAKDASDQQRIRRILVLGQ